MNKLINEVEGIVRWPKKPSDKNFVIEWLSQMFESEKQYSEKELQWRYLHNPIHKGDILNCIALRNFIKIRQI